MANLIDYIIWRGDITFEQSGVNEIDGLIFSQFAYLPFTDILKEGFEEGVTIGQAAEQYFATHSRQRIASMPELARNCSRLLEHMMHAPRYRDLQVIHFVDRFDPVSVKQFAAMVITLGRKEYFVAFRGTDDTLAGWEEDFKLAYMCPVASQVESVAYLKEVFDQLKGEFYIGGHSKGGNLAIYSAMKLPAREKKRIRIIYNYDGPGFLEEIIDTAEYQSTAAKVISFMPQGSIVGMILFHEEEYHVIKSNEKGFYQHTAVSWEVLGRQFCDQDGFVKASLLFNSANKAWINEISVEQRALFIEVMFQILRSGEDDTVSGLKADFLASANNIIKSYSGLDKNTRKLMKNVLGQIIKLSTRTISETRKKQKSAEIIEEK